MDTLKGMCGNYPDFQIKEYALNWYSKGKLNEDDLAELDEYLSAFKVEDETPVKDEETVKIEDEVNNIENIEGTEETDVNTLEDVQVSTQENAVNENETNAV